MVTQYSGKRFQRLHIHLLLFASIHSFNNFSKFISCRINVLFWWHFSSQLHSVLFWNLPRLSMLVWNSEVKRNGYEMSFLQDSFRLNEISKKYSFITRSTSPSPLRFLTKRRNNLQNITYGWEARLYKICNYWTLSFV